jgi:excisionase family DNA binding protein
MNLLATRHRKAPNDACRGCRADMVSCTPRPQLVRSPVYAPFCREASMTATSPRPSVNAGGQLHDVDSAADYLRCGRRLIYRLVAERRVKFTYAGRTLRFWQTDLDAYLEARAVDPIHPPLPR